MAEDQLNNVAPTANVSDGEGAAPRKNTVRTAIIIVLIVIVAALAGWYWYSMQGQRSQANGTAQAADETVAIVNGEELKRSEYEQVLAQTKNALAQQGGTAQTPEEQKQIESQAMDTLVSQTLVLQAAAQAGITPSNEDIESQLSQVSAQFGDGTAFESALAAQGLSKDVLREQISQKLTIQSYLKQNVDLSTITVTDAEVEAFYNEISANSKSVPPLEEVREQVKNSLIQQKQQEKIATVVDDLRSQGDVEILL